MKRIYVVIGELEDTDQIDIFDSAYINMDRAEQRCIELENHPDGHIYYWREVILEEEEGN